MSNPTLKYKENLYVNLPDGVEVSKVGYYVIAESKVLPKLANAKKYQEQLVRNKYDLSPPDPEPELVE